MNLKTTYRVGSADEADIVLKQTTVSKQHCELRWIGNGWELRDLDSTNGTFVDGVRITDVCKVHSNNKITLGRGVALSLPPTPSSPTKRESAFSELDQPKLPKTKLKAALYVGLFSMGLTAITVCFGIYFFSSAGPSLSKEIDRGSETVSSSDEKKSQPKTGESDTGQKSSPQKSPQATPAVESAFWAIIVESADGKNRQLVGTAVGIEPNRLLTLASIVEAIQELKTSYPVLLLQQWQQDGVSIMPTQIVLHPGYKSALSQLTEFETQLEEKLKTVDNLAQPSLEDSLEWSGRLETVMSDISKCDLACLITVDRLKKVLPIATASRTSEPQDCKIAGYPMIVPSPDLKSKLEGFYLEGKGRVQFDNKMKTPSLFVETSAFPGVPIVSMVCLNSLSEIAGLCVRQEPVQSVGAPQRSQITSVEVFWK
jgi:pSer/pThr/pTyr-binding forkhead associated (FHA) protein